MSQAHFVRKLLSWVVTVVALGLFYAGEALAVCCKKTTGCSCTTSLSCPIGSTKVTSCSTSGGGLTLNGSRINCIADSQTVGTVSAAADSDLENPNVGATWTEIGLGVSCNKTDDTGLISEGETGKFDLAVEYKMKAPASCNNETGELTYQAFCGQDVTVRGTLKPSTGTTPPAWVTQMCTDSKGKVVECSDPLLVLGGFQTDKKGFVDLNKCLTNFPNQQNAGGLPAGQVLLYKEFFAPGTNCTGPRVSASDGQRRMCQDHTFFNPDYDETTGIGATNPPCDPEAKVTYTAGILATDKADIIAATLYENQWSPNATLNLSCNNQGTVPTTVVNSENIAVSGFRLTDGPIVAYVKGFPADVSPATSATPIFDANGAASGLRITFNDCTAGRTGLDNVICRHIGANAQTVDLSIRAEQADGQGLGFIGDALGVPVNNVSNCVNLQ